MSSDDALSGIFLWGLFSKTEGGFLDGGAGGVTKMGGVTERQMQA